MTERHELFHEFLHDTKFDDFPETVKTSARYWLLDLVGVAASGRNTGLSGIICDHAVEHFGGSKSRILFDGRKASPAGAALAGGMIIDSLDAHDGFNLAKGHAGCGVLPSLLALSEAEGVQTFDGVLTGLVIGYEFALRAGVALHQTVPDYHTSGAWVSIAAAALGARMMNLSRDQTRHAIGIAEYHGPRSQMMRVIDTPTMLKDGSGWGAMTGVSAAYLARDGFTGAPAVTVEANEVAELWSDLGKHWKLLDQYYKPFPVCRWAQPGIQAVLNLRQEHALTSQDIESIELTTFHESLRLAVSDPTTTEEAQYSTTYSTAVAMVKGTVGPNDVAEESFADPEIRRLAQSMQVSEKQEYNNVFPAQRCADVTLVLKDGSRLNSGKTVPSGEHDNPVSHEEMKAKFRNYSVPHLGQERSASIEEFLLSRPPDTPVETLFDLLTDPIRQ